MPLIFYEFPHPIMKNLVDQMNEVEAVKVSLQSERAHNKLEEYGKQNVSLFNLTRHGINSLSNFDKLELFILEATRNHLHSKEIPGTLVVSIAETLSLTIDSTNGLRFKICVDSYENFDQHNGPRNNLTFGIDVVPTVYDQDSAKHSSFWQDKLHGFSVMLNLFLNKFNMPVKEMIIDGSENNDLPAMLRIFAGFYPWTQLPVVKVGQNKTLHDEDMSYVLNHFTATDVFEVHSKASSQFQFDGIISSDCIKISNGHWFKLRNQLERENTRSIDVDGITISKAEVKTFVERWAEGYFPRLKALHLHSKKKIWPNFDNLPRYTGYYPQLARQMTRPIRHQMRIAGKDREHAFVWSHTEFDFNLKVSW